MTATIESTGLDTWRTELRTWLDANVPKRRVRSEDDDEQEAEMFADQDDTDAVAKGKALQKKLYDAGYVGITWPTEFGGQGLTNEHQRVFNEESADYDMSPLGIYTIGLGMVAPTILEHGNDEQKKRYLPKALSGEEIWSQLFSEPGAGSDVASLQTRAVRDGEEWVINGQKVWTSGAHYSDYGAIIARTDPDQPKHRGISMLIVDMRAPGVTIKPLRQITGGANFNEVFFDDVRVPAGNLIGEANEGWRYAITMLMNERVAIGAGGGGARRSGAGGFASLVKLAQLRGVDQDPVIRQGLADVYIRQTVLGYIGLRIRAALKAGKSPGAEGSIAKLYSALLARDSSDLGLQIAGASGVAWPADDPRGDRWALLSLSAPASAIAGGTNEIQHNIIGERVLGLPKDPAVDRDVPFRELRVGTQRD